MKFNSQQTNEKRATDVRRAKTQTWGLITGNGNMSTLMSACFYLEMKMYLCCPDPFTLSIS